MPEDAVAKGQPPLTLQVLADALCVGDVVVKGVEEQRVVLLPRF